MSLGFIGRVGGDRDVGERALHKRRVDDGIGGTEGLSCGVSDHLDLASDLFFLSGLFSSPLLRWGFAGAGREASGFRWGGVLAWGCSRLGGAGRDSGFLGSGRRLSGLGG
jgi:hypothetical protein